MRHRRRQARRLDERAHVGESGIAADGTGILAHELHAVVVGRVVARGHHDAAVKFVGKGCEVHAFRTAEADVGDVAAAVHEPALQRIRKLAAR